jgi:hypothetical protein
MKTVRSVRFPEWMDDVLTRKAKINERSFSMIVIRMIKKQLQEEGIEQPQK